VSALSTPPELGGLTFHDRFNRCTRPAVRACGNNRLAAASVHAAYEAHRTRDHARVPLVLPKPAFQWQLVVAARDPVSNDEFVKQAPRLIALLTSDAQSRALPIPATLLSPTTRNRPRPQSGQRFGTFRWRSSPSDDVVAEIVEFAYDDDARCSRREDFS
jgi:hypothetical protein